MSRPQMTVDELMTTTVNALHGTDPLVRAREVMESEHVRQVPIVDTDGGVIGMLATGDLARALASGRGEAVEIEAHMARAVLTVRRETPAHEAARIMLQAHVAALPVIADDDHIVGMVTESDFLAVARRALNASLDAPRAAVVDAW